MSLVEAQGRPIPPAVALPGSIGAQVFRIRQEEDLWCWVACVLMVLINSRFLRQCDIAQEAFPGRTCCQIPTPCGQALEPARVQFIWGRFGFTNVMRHCGPVSVDTLRIELGAGRPVEVWLGQMTSCNDFTGSGHVVLIVSLYDNNGAPWMTIRDSNPKGELTEISLSGLTHHSSYGPWVGSWTGIG